MNKGVIALSLAAVALAGCSSSDEAAKMSKMDELTNQVSQLSNQVNELSQQVSSLQSGVDTAGDAAMYAKEEAMRANKRIDNIAQSYTK